MSSNKTKKIIKTKLTDKNGKLATGKALEKMMEGNCIFPFTYKDQVYNECFKGANGDWCATKVNKEGKMKRFAYCVYDEPKTKKKIIKKKKGSVKKMNNSRPSNNTKKLNQSKINKNYNLPNKKKVMPNVWELPNRKGFGNWFDKTFITYRAKKGAIKKASKDFDFFPHQKLISDYLQASSPYRGILLYHGLGVGKTCASIAIAEGFRDDRKIIVLLNKSLKQNFRGNLMFCGFEYYRYSQHWVWHKFTGADDEMIRLARNMGIPRKYYNKYGGAWFIDFSKPPNFSSLSLKDQEKLTQQLNDTIDAKYTFYNMDGLNQKRLEKMVENRVFDNSILVIDEVHNLSNAMSKANPGVRGKYLERLIMDAKNLKCVFLSGTPMINNLFEISKLFNLLRGYIITYNFNLKPTTSSPKQMYGKLNTILKDHPLVDQYFINEKDHFIRLTKNPDGFISQKDGLV